MNELVQWRWSAILFLTASNVFMTFAWYGHLKFKSAPLWLAILASWGIALFEYILMVPANRWGSSHFSVFQLKIIQEVITLVVFTAFAVLFIGTRLKWNYVVAFICILAAVAFTFMPDSKKETKKEPVIVESETAQSK